MIEMDPQPVNVAIIHRIYSKLRRDLTYERRISYIDNGDVFLAEYIGKFSQKVEPHGNAGHGSEYVRTHPLVMKELTETGKTKQKVKKSYEELKSSVMEAKTLCSRSTFNYADHQV